MTSIRWRTAPVLLLLAASCAEPDESSPASGDATGESLVAGGVSFRTVLGQRYLGAQNNGGGAVIATATTAQAWETFSLDDINAGTLQSGDTVFIRAGGGQYFQAANGGGSTLNAASVNRLGWETFRIVKASGSGTIANGDVVGLQTVTTGNWVSAENGGGGTVFAYGAALGSWEQLTISGLSSQQQPPPGGPDFGPNTLIFDPSMSASTIQGQLNAVFNQMQSNQFGPERHALLFKPGTYNVDVNVGFYTQVLGLGQSPDATTINGAVHAEADWFQGNATQNFWRAAENLAVVPTGGTDRWAVSQAAPLRRMHIRGSMILDDGGWSSGGFLADSRVDGQINSGGQQQWLTRNSQIGSWVSSNWNMVFVGVNGAPSGASWPNPPYTVISQAPVVREKPFLTVDSAGNYSVFVPSLSTNSAGITWGGGSSPGQSIPIGQFFIAKPGVDGAATMNAALSQGKHLLITPGVYHLDDTLRVGNAGTVVLGLGLATLVPDRGVVAMSVADVDGVRIAGILFDAGTTSSPILLEVGPTGSAARHAANPTSLHDLFFRVGGATVGKAALSLKINSSDVIGDHFWLWRADHGNGGTVGWGTNTAANGLIVNGANVTIYGLFVEHYQAVQTLWNGNGGKLYFYQSEMPYDVPNQAGWMNGGANGFASYKVADGVTSHGAWGVGIYCFFNVNSGVRAANAIEVPQSGLNGAMFHDMTTVSLGGVGEITHVIDGFGGTANGGNQVVRLAR